MRPAVILARVSSAEQEAGHSLEAQLANLQEYAQRRDLDVIETFRIIESSTKGHRPEFERMIEFIGKQKTRTALIVDCVDRLQRSFTHTPVLNALMVEDNAPSVYSARPCDLCRDGQEGDLFAGEGQVCLNDITFEAQDNDDANFKFKEALCNIVVLLSKSHDLFGSSHVDEKRKLLGFVFENLQLEGSTLRFSLRKPFELLAQLPDNPVWRPLRPANQYFTVCQETDLTHYLPCFIGFS